MAVRRVAAFVVATLATVLVLTSAVPAAALPATPWTGRWLIPAAQTVGAGDQVVTLTQTGSSITGPFSWCGGGNWTGTISADGTTWTGEFLHPAGQPGCSGTGHGTFTVRMAADGRSFTGSGSTDFGSGFTFSGTYIDGGVEPRTTTRRPSCPGGPWSGQWTTGDGTGRFSFVQRGSSLSGVILDAPVSHTATISGDTARGTYRRPEGTGSTLLTLAPDGNSFRYTGTTIDGATDTPFTSTFVGCSQGLAGVDLTRTIPNPQTLRAGPTSITAPGRVSLTSLRRSKCVLVKVASAKPARVLVSIFSGRRSIRLFGQKLVVFVGAGKRQVCIPVPFRAHTFNVRTPVRVALGYALGARRTPGERKPPPRIGRIKLVP
jgi:hypothetical protein